jgi:hypothetical protein
MLRLYLRFYIALVASLLLFVVAIVALWNFTGGPVAPCPRPDPSAMARRWLIRTAGPSLTFD